MVYHPETKNPVLFRYYDPRVLVDFLPNCDGEQAQEFFGTIQAYFSETADGTDILAFYRQALV